MRTPRIPPLRVALLSTWVVVVAADARADGPVVVPDDRVVNFSVEAVGSAADAAEFVEPIPIEPVGAETALMPHESLPLGDPPLDTGVPQTAMPADRDGAFDTTRSEVLRVGGPLLGVVALMILLGAAVRRFGGPLTGGGRPSGVLEVLGRYPIARGQQLVLLRMVSRVVLLHQSRNGLTTLSEVADPDEVAALLARVESATRSGQPGRFQGLLAGAAARQDGFGGEMTTQGKVVVDLTRRATPRASRRSDA